MQKLIALVSIFVCACADGGADPGGGGAGARGSGDGGSAENGGGGGASDLGGAGGGGGDVATAVCDWQACGGDPIGHWAYASACVELPTTPGPCAGSYSGSRLYLTGTLDLDADGSAHVDTTMVQETVIYYPKACWAPGATKCEDFVQAPDFDLSCVNTATDCTCTIIDSQVNGPSDDTFTNEGGHIVLSDGTDFTYCADPNHLLLIHETGERTYLDAATK